MVDLFNTQYFANQILLEDFRNFFVPYFVVVVLIFSSTAIFQLKEVSALSNGLIRQHYSINYKEKSGSWIPKEIVNVSCMISRLEMLPTL